MLVSFALLFFNLVNCDFAHSSASFCNLLLKLKLGKHNIRNLASVIFALAPSELRSRYQFSLMLGEMLPDTVAERSTSASFCPGLRQRILPNISLITFVTGSSAFMSTCPESLVETCKVSLLPRIDRSDRFADHDIRIGPSFFDPLNVLSKALFANSSNCLMGTVKGSMRLDAGAGTLDMGGVVFSGRAEENSVLWTNLYHPAAVTKRTTMRIVVRFNRYPLSCAIHF